MTLDLSHYISAQVILMKNINMKYKFELERQWEYNSNNVFNVRIEK